MEALFKGVPPETTPKPLWYVLISLVSDLAFIVLVTVLQAVSFAFMGEEMARPMWKCTGWKDALKRFFLPWFILNLLFITSARVPMSMPEPLQMEAHLVMALFRLGLTVLGVPIGACIVYGGGLVWKEIPAMLAPFFRLFPMAFVALALGFLQGLIIDVASGMLREVPYSVWVWSVVNVPLILLECLAFAVMWLVCMHYRDIADEYGDDDFDF